MCLRGHRSSVGRPSTTNIDLAYSEGHLESGGLVYFQLSSTLTPSAGGGGKGSPSSQGKKVTSLVSLLFFLQSLIELKISKFSLNLFVYFFCNIIMTGEPTHTASKERMAPKLMFLSERMTQLSKTSSKVQWPLCFAFSYVRDEKH